MPETFVKFAAYQFKNCHPVNPVTLEPVLTVLKWFMWTGSSLFPIPRADGPHRNCDNLPRLEDVVTEEDRKQWYYAQFPKGPLHNLDTGEPY